MSGPATDTPSRLLADLRKLIVLHQDFGIVSYPQSPEVVHFLNVPLPATATSGGASTPPLGQKGKEGPAAILPPPRSTQTLLDIQAELGDCRRCPLHETRQRIVFGSGNPKAALFIVGEFPTQDDEVAEAPFSGEAKALLAKMLQAIGLGLDEVYLASVVKCRSAGNGPPLPAQVKTCLPFLLSQIDAVAPKVICAMGPLAAQTLLHSTAPLVRLRGSVHDCHGVPLIPTFHPDFLIKNTEMKKAAWTDLQLIQAKLGVAKARSPIPA